MRINEILNESFSSILYHASSFEDSISILTSGHFDLSHGTMLDDIPWTFDQEEYPKTGKARERDSFSLDAKYQYKMSFARTKWNGYSRGLLGGDGGGVIFQIDGNWLNQRYKGRAIDSYGFNRITTTRPDDWGDPEVFIGHSEAEDRLWSRKQFLPITPIIAAHIWFDLNNIDREDTVYHKFIKSNQVTEFIKICYSKNIPVFKYNSLRDLMTGSNPEKNPKNI